MLKTEAKRRSSCQCRGVHLLLWFMSQPFTAATVTGHVTVSLALRALLVHDILSPSSQLRLLLFSALFYMFLLFLRLCEWNTVAMSSTKSSTVISHTRQVCFLDRKTILTVILFLRARLLASMLCNRPLNNSIMINPNFILK